MALITSRVSLVILGLGLGLFAAGCSTSEQAAGKPKPKLKYVYLPATGSHIGRRVLVNEDGTLVDASGVPILTADPSVLTDLQRKGNVNRGRGN